MDFLISIATFDPIPADIFYDVLGVWDFQWTNNPSNRPSLERIGIEDRIFVFTLGSMFLFMFAFFVSRSLAVFLGCCKKNYMVRKAYRMLDSETPIKSILVVFYCELYIDLLLGGLVNSENDYLLEEPSNWGPNGNLSGSDQFTVILGNFFYFTAMIFPFVAIYLLHRKSREHFSPSGLAL